MHVCNAPVGGVFNRQHRQIRAPLTDSFDHILKRTTGKWGMVWAGNCAGFMRVGAQFSLKGDNFGLLTAHFAKSLM
jgi:hypothetical protein